MKLGRACAAAAVLWAVALPFTAGTALADEAPVATSPQAPPVATTPNAPAPSAEPAPPSDPRERPVQEGAAPAEDQVPVRPRGAPETGGGPEEPGIDLVVAGGAATVIAVVAGGAVLVSRRRRAGAH